MTDETTAEEEATPTPRTVAQKLFSAVLALSIGLAGALVFVRLTMPLPWVLGPMSFCLVASALGLPVALPRFAHPPAVAVVGILVGIRVSPDTLGQIVLWWPTLLTVGAYVVIAGAISMAYLYRVKGLDFPTAFYAGMPGGLVEMVVMAERHGGNVRTVAIIHSVRIVGIVFTLPLLAQFVTGVPLGARGLPGVPIMETSAVSWLWLALAGIVGSFAAIKLRWPAPYLLGPLVVTGAVHIAGLSDFTPASEVVAAAQVIIGTMLGCRFSGTPLRRIAAELRLAVAPAVIPLALTLAFAYAAQAISQADFLTLILTYSAGGVAESTLIAVALHLDVAFITAHQFVRILLVVACATPAFALVRRIRERRIGTDKGAP